MSKIEITQDGGKPLTATLPKPSLGTALAACEIFFKTVTELYAEDGENGLSFQIAGLSACYGGYIKTFMAANEVSDVEKLQGAVIASHFVDVVRGLGNPEAS